MLDPRRGAVAVGARPFLVAFNAFLDTDDVEVARQIARPTSGRAAAASPHSRRWGWVDGGEAQVSMNLTDLERTPIPVALEAVNSEANDLGASVESTELVGLAPLAAILDTARYYLGLRELAPHDILETRLYGPPDFFFFFFFFF